MTVALQVLPFFLLMGAGWACARAGLFDSNVVQGLTRYVYWIAFPALLIHSLALAPPPSAQVLRSLEAYGIGVAALTVIALLVARFAVKGDARALLPLAGTVGNDAFIGLPLTASLLGAAAAGWAAAMVAFDWAVIAPLTLAWLHLGAARRADPADHAGPSHAGPSVALQALGRAARSPVTLAAVLGAILMVLRPTWPTALDHTVAAMAASSSPAGLAGLGAMMGLSGAQPDPADRKPILIALALKLLLAPACVFAALKLAGAPPTFVATGVIVAACPTAVTVFIQAQALGVFAHGAARTVALATLASAVTLTGLAAVLVGR